MLTGIVIVLVFAGIVIAGVAAVLLYAPVSQDPAEDSDTCHSVQPEQTGEVGDPSENRTPATTVRRLGFGEFIAIINQAAQVAILGETNSGKTTLAEAIMRHIKGALFVLDPNYEEGKWGGLDVVTTDEDDGYGPLDNAIRAVFEEMRQRVTLKRHKQPVGERINVFWDEINDHMEESELGGDHLRRLIKRARNYDIKLWIFPHSRRVKALQMEGHGDSLTNLAWVYLGDQARVQLSSMVRQKRVPASEAERLSSKRWLALVEWAGVVYEVDREAVPVLARGPSLAHRQWRPSVAIEQTSKAAPLTIDHVMAAFLLGRNEAAKATVENWQPLSGRGLDELLNGKSGGRSSVKLGEVIQQVKTTIEQRRPGYFEEVSNG